MNIDKIKLTTFLRESVTPVIAFMVLYGAWKILQAILFNEVKVNENIQFYILGFISAKVSDIINFYFSSTRTQQDRARVELESKAAESVTSTLTEVKQTPAPTIKPAIDDDMRFKLTGLGYQTEDIAAMSYDQAVNIITTGKTKKP